MTKNQLNTLITGAFATTMVAGAATEAAANKSAEKEKCYGVVEAGHNMCGNASGTHSCAGMASVDGDGGEWLTLPKGVCDKLVGGSLTPYEGTELPAAKNGDQDAAQQG